MVNKFLKTRIIKKPELLAPAGNLEKLKIAFAYGADAVYTGSTEFSLRRASGNFTNIELQKAIEYSYSLKKKIYPAINIICRNKEIKKFSTFLEKINTWKPHAFIISDPGIFHFVRKYSNIPCHISTQASTASLESARFWYEQGASRIILARELSLEECIEIKNNLAVELEIFIHGAMCTGYSGKCIISNFTAGRDANCGGCIQNCRYTYNLYDGYKKLLKKASYYMNTRDLMTIEILPEIIKTGIDSLKIEGRMKSKMYLANTVSIYRDAIDTCFEAFPDLNNYEEKIINWKKDLAQISNRTFTTGHLKTETEKDIIRSKSGTYIRKVEFAGTVKEILPNGKMAIEVKSRFSVGDKLELYAPGANGKTFFIAQSLQELSGKDILRAKPGSIVLIPEIKNSSRTAILKKHEESCE